MREWLGLATYLLRVQWSDVWQLPLWLWLQYVDFCEQYLATQKEGVTRG